MKRIDSVIVRFLFTGLLGLFLAGLAYGQLGTGVITGTVTDPSGGVVPGGAVTLVHTTTGVQRTAQTNALGIYRFDFADVGTYNLRVSASGFAVYELDGLVVTVGQTVSANVTLELGKTGTVVTVEAQGVQMVNTANAQISDLINRTTIQNLPLEVRDTTLFVNLVPGSTPNEFNGTGRGAAINGMRTGMGNFMVDGADNNDYGLGGSTKDTPGSIPGGVVSISPEAVQEFSVVTNNFSAEYGRQGGFVADVVLKSGTNAWHGSAFEYNRNSTTTADDFFSARVGAHDVLIRNQFGGSLGGPIKKDKMFIFGAVEFHRYRQRSPETLYGSTPDFVNFVNTGGLANFLTTNNIVNVPCPGPGCTLGPVFQQLYSKYPFPTPTFDLTNENSSPILTTATGLPLQYPVTAFGEYTVPLPTTFREDRMDYRYDYQISGKDTVTGHYLYDLFHTFMGFGGDFYNAAFNETEPGRSQNASAGWTHTFSPTVVSEARVTYLRATAPFPDDHPGIPSIGPIDASYDGFGDTGNLPQFFTQNTFQYQDNLSITHGKHTFKLGGEYRRTRNGSAFEAESNGLFEFWDTEDMMTDGAIGDLMGLGGWYVSEQSINPSSPTPALPDYYRGYRANELGWYVEDQLKASKSLTLTLGLRYDYFGVPHNYVPGIDSNYYDGSPNFNQCIIRNANGSVVCYPGDPTLPSATASYVSNNPFYPVNPYTAAVFSGTFQTRNNDIWDKDTNNFAPRVGIAWDVFGNHKTILRTGGGIFYDRMYNNIFENMRFNPPFFAFSEKGLVIDGTTQGPISTPGFYSVPVNVAEFAGKGATPSARQMAANMLAAYSEQVNFDIQHQLANNWMLDVAYVGTFAHKLMGLVDTNTFAGRLVNTAVYSSRRINPNLGTDNTRGNWYNSNYNAAQVKISKRFAHGFQFETNYTWSHALDYVSDVFYNRASVYGNSFPEDDYNRSLEYGNADFDLRHRWVAYGVWDLPVFSKNRWLGGWSLDGTFIIQSGSPFTISDASVDSNADGNYNDRGDYIGTGSPMSTVTHTKCPADGYITNTAMFIATPPNPATGWADGLLGRNVMTGPKYVDSDLSLSKKFKFTERLGLKVIGSAFNFLNHPNFGYPVGNIAAFNFGMSTATIAPNNSQTGARVMQFAVRLDF